MGSLLHAKNLESSKRHRYAKLPVVKNAIKEENM